MLNYSDYAKEFEKGAIEVEKKMFWPKWKVFIIIGIFVATILIVIGALIYLQSH